MRLFASLVLTLAPTFVAADALCDELWLTRNTVFDAYGYCFGSDLGQAIFDNSDCKTTSAALRPADDAFVARIRAIETETACSVDTSQTVLDLDYVIERRTLADLPIPSEGESACLGYKGPALLLTAGRHPDTAFYGEILPGMDVFIYHEPVDGMAFVVLDKGGIGWVGSHLFTPETCTGMAG